MQTGASIPMGTRAWSLGACVWLLCIGPVAHAAQGDACMQDTACTEHDEAGLRLVEDRQYAKALHEFRAAFALQPVARLRISIGRCLYRLGRYREALDEYERFAAAEPDADDQTRSRVARYVEEARLELSRESSHRKVGALLDVRPVAAETTTAPDRGDGAGSAGSWARGALLAGGLCTLAGGLGFAIAAEEIGNNLVVTTDSVPARWIDLGQKLSAVGITMAVVGGASVIASFIWAGTAAARSPSRKYSPAPALPTGQAEPMRDGPAAMGGRE